MHALQVSLGHASQQGPQPRNEDFVGAATPEGEELAAKGVLLAVAEALSDTTDARTAAEAAVAAAERTVSETRNLASARGRAAWVGQRSVGEPDPGSVAVLRFLEALRDRIG